MYPAAASVTATPAQGAATRSTQPYCNSTYNNHPKMLHSLLYNFRQHVNGFVVPNAGSVSSTPAAPLSPVPTVRAAAMVIASPSSSGAVSPTPSHESRRHNPIHRPRSGSVISLGSTGSSVRDSYSPSYESSTSHDSFSHGSPASVRSSPSPSPPAHEGSKLFGILKGTMSSQYGSYVNSCTFPVSSQLRTPPRSIHTPALAISSPPPHGIKRSISDSNTDDWEPMDLSCKRLCSDTSPSAPSTPFSSHDLGTSSSQGSILKSILCGGSRSLCSSSSQYYNNCKKDTPPNSGSSSSPDMAATAPLIPCAPPARRESTSSVSSNASSASVSRPSSSHLRVAVAKKMMLPVRARVSDWMLKVVHFARSQTEFASLPSLNDKLLLLSQAWARILLLFMAETNFEFAVTPIHGEEDDGKWDAECPTMKSVQQIQAFITKCQMLNMDAQEYHLMRMALLFYSGEYLLHLPVITCCVLPN